MRLKDVADSIQSEKVSVNEVPAYYTMSLQCFCVMIVLYFFCYVVLCMFLGYPDSCGMVIPWLAALAVLFYFYDSIPIWWTLRCIAVFILTWVSVFAVQHGWNCGVQHFMIPLMIIFMFSIYTSLRGKIFMGILIMGVRMMLFYYCEKHEAVYPFENHALYAIQLLSTIAVGISIVCVCLIFSTNIQKSEAQLIIHNDELKKEASTDALTGLRNRRYMMDVMEKQIANHPQSIFCVAMGDIDLFKRINDTYGHECGDEVLRRLAELFQSHMTGESSVCRWGGEEFFFFMPGMNLDEASSLIMGLNIAVSSMEIQYKDIICQVTMTFGLEEYDFSSGLKDIIKSADEKLYYGKNHGRNQVIF